MNSVLEQTVKTYVERATAGGSLDRVFTELATFTELVAGSRRLSKLLADADVPAEAKASVINDVTKQSFDATTVELLAAVAGAQRSSTGDLPGTFADITAEVGFAAATAAGTIASVEASLYEFSMVLDRNVDLRQALNDPAVDDDAKKRLVTTLLEGKSDSRAIRLLQMLIALDHGQNVDESALRLSKRAAARRGTLIAEIRTAVELDAVRKSQLTLAIGSAVGSAVEGRFSVDPTIIGSVVVRVGDEVLDGSVRHRLEQARQAVAG